MNVLILCTGNSCRSILGEALINHYFKKNNVEAYSAGVSAKGIINPNALKALEQDGIDTAYLCSKNLDKLNNIAFDLVVTVCDNAKESCPIFLGNTEVIHVGFEDPDGKEYAEFIKTKDEIYKKLLPIIKKKLIS